MENLAIKLKRSSKLNKNLFNYSIRKCVGSQGPEFAKTGEIQRLSIIIKSEKDENDGVMSTFPAIRRKNRFNSLAMHPSISSLMEGSIHQK